MNNLQAQLTEPAEQVLPVSWDVPPTEYVEWVGAVGRFRLRLLVRTSKLHGSPNYLYQVYVPGEGAPILELISRPGKRELADAVTKYRARKS